MKVEMKNERQQQRENKRKMKNKEQKKSENYFNIPHIHMCVLKLQCMSRECKNK